MRTTSTEPYVPDDETVIYRYMDDRKFADLFKAFDDHGRWRPTHSETTQVEYKQPPGRLWFGYPLFFDGSREATFPDVNSDPERYVEAVLAHKDVDPEAAARFRERYLKSDNQIIRKGIHLMANLCGASCWEANPRKKPTLWSMVGGDGVAIRSTCGAVCRSLLEAQWAQRGARVGYCAVGYVDHSTHSTVDDGYRGLLALIQRRYSYENEVRFVARSPALAAINMNISLEPGQPLTLELIFEQASRVVDELRAAYTAMKKSYEEGFRLPVNPATLITEVVIKPGSSANYEAKVKERLAQAGCTHVVVRTA